jgi:hypothetical protein
MSKKITPKQNSANTLNPNKGTTGTNKQYDQNQGNKGKQLNPTPNDSNTNKGGGKKTN